MMANLGESFSQTNNVSPEGNGGDDLYTELWKLCAGPLVEVPRANERVYYFPQGHMEQLEASTNQEFNQRIPMFNLPSKILCRVVHIRLLAEKETDEVYAQVTLLPDPNQSEPTTPDPCPLRHALGNPTQKLVAKDLHGYEWRFKHIFRGQPRRHLLTTGWSTFVTSKRLVAGDSFVFLRGEKDELRVGVRRAVRQHSIMPTSVISSLSMHVGVLATASHAVSTQTLFVVYYKPRTSRFIIGLNKYLEAVTNKFTVGVRFKMRFEEEDSPERRFAGTIVGFEDFSPHWKDSKWRSLKIEPFSTHVPPSLAQPVAAKKKRPRPPAEIPAIDISSKASSPWNSGVMHSNDLTPQNIPAEAKANENPVMWHRIQTEMSSSCSSVTETPNEGSWLSSPGFSVSHHLFPDTIEEKTRLSDWHIPPGFSNPQLNHNPTFDPIEKFNRSETAASCRLFGIEVINHSASSTPLERTSAQLSTMTMVLTERLDPSTLSSTDSDQKSNLSKVLKRSRNGNSYQQKRSRAGKVHLALQEVVRMQGIAVGRAVDLAMFEGYDELINELEKMFGIKGELRPWTKWEIVYTDDDGDMMLVGDDPWPQDVKKMSRRSKLPLASIEGEETIISSYSSEK
ncbi:Auxin response factor 9 isoform 3 [Hibiscus syriacus]|uniref:Auxin response factor n=1 Tax=Hibiscus syriacus TaxID=106335 RepID=A0A6A3C0B2_HIBSY|nr:Auxin response factor 9 isoform 3 [Hibiscus syriacus]